MADLTEARPCSLRRGDLTSMPRGSSEPSWEPNPNCVRSSLDAGEISARREPVARGVLANVRAPGWVGIGRGLLRVISRRSAACSGRSILPHRGYEVRPRIRRRDLADRRFELRSRRLRPFGAQGACSGARSAGNGTLDVARLGLLALACRRGHSNRAGKTARKIGTPGGLLSLKPGTQELNRGSRQS